MYPKAFLYLALIAIAGLTFSACSDDDNEKDTQAPVVENLEVGHNDTLHIGEAMHLEFSVTDNDKLSHYRVVMHKEDDHLKSATTNDFGQIDSTFTEIMGLRNYNVHKDLTGVTSTLSEGYYHFDLSVTDMAGNTTQLERDVYATEEEGGNDDIHNQ